MLDPAALDKAIDGWEQLKVAGFDGSTCILVVCPMCLAAVRRIDAANHVEWHVQSGLSETAG